MFLSVVLVVVAGFAYLIFNKNVQVAEAAPAFVKEVGNTNIGASSALCTINVPAGGVALGNLIVGVATSESGQDISSVTDSRGNSYTVSALTFNAAGTDWGQNVFYGRATTALQSGDTITVTFLNSYFDAKICRALEYSGIASSGFFDGSSVGLDDAFPQSSTGSTGSVSSTGSNDLLVVFCSAATNPITWTNTANFSSRGSTINAGSLSVYSEDRIASSSGSYSAGPGLSSSQYWICHILAFKAAPFSNNSSINIRGGGSGTSVKARVGGGSQTPAYVQSNTNFVGGNATNSASFSSNVSSGNLIAIGAFWQSNTITLNSITADCVSGNFVLLSNPTSYSTVSRAAMGYAIINSSGSCTISANFSSAVNSQILFHEVSGINTSSPLDGSTMRSQTTPGTGVDAVSSGNITTTQNGDYIFGLGIDASQNSPTWTAGSGFGLKASDTRIQSEDRIQTVAGSIAATFTINLSFASPIVGIMAFKPGASAGLNNGIKFR